MLDHSFLKPLGVYGYDAVEPLILASLVTEDPLLLVGLHGTGKTYLLNSLSEALELEHRHYNASLIAFDDLVGFPFPDESKQSIRYLPTPATVWQAESVLVDELNRCRPEHQNRFFSLINERRIQGIALDRLRYRWAAMNPSGAEHGYIGAEPLDPALADRFAFIVRVADWPDLSEGEQRLIADPRGDGAISRDGGRLREFLKTAKKQFEAALKTPDPLVLQYAQLVCSSLGEASLRLSPRRARQLARNLLAASVVSALPKERLFRLVLENSIPQFATGEQVLTETVHAAHCLAWDSVALTGREKWLHEFACEPDLVVKARSLFASCPDPDTGSVAVAQLLAAEPPHRRFAFTLAVTPKLLAHKCSPVGAEGLADLSQVLATIVHQDDEIPFNAPAPEIDGKKAKYHPSMTARWVGELREYQRVQPLLASIPEAERDHAAQFIDAVILEEKCVPEPLQPMVDDFVRLLRTVRKDFV